MADFTRRIRFADRFHYRRRTDNAGHKTGNLWEWLERRGSDFDYMIVLDADSLMSGGAIRRLVRVMDGNPRLGICQTLIAGLPSRVAFTRMFQFGMRHGMRAYTLGGTWWQGPAGPYWGHNAIIRVDAFMRHCRLPALPGHGPLSGLVLSHDQLEAAQMVRGGYEVRVLPDEYGSYEINPPCLPEFVRRSLRWCQGNLQYLKLVTKPGWPPMARLQLALAILMYLSGPAWLVFMALGFMQGALGLSGETVAQNPWGRAAIDAQPVAARRHDHDGFCTQDRGADRCARRCAPAPQLWRWLAPVARRNRRIPARHDPRADHGHRRSPVHTRASARARVDLAGPAAARLRGLME